MGKLDKLIGKFFDNLRQGKADAFTRDIMKNPEARQAKKDLKKAETKLLDFLKQKHKESEK
jgi:hypothetical protein|tara:strand:- start:1213 stop:1395 length:183 start_codon:yes stop_codon:yes gene_type:complete